MNELLQRLDAKARRGSKPRCHWLTQGEDIEVARRLTRLIAPWGEVTAEDRWMPGGFVETEEAELHEAERLIPEEAKRECIRDWWFEVRRGAPTGQCFDIASTCTVRADGAAQRGLLLVEAKAHEGELSEAAAGKRLEGTASDGQRRNDAHIRRAIDWANGELAAATGLAWRLSADDRYQMSNRFAMACKLTELGYAVALVYLGFLEAEEMRDKGRPFRDAGDWKRAVLEHSRPLFPDPAWDRAMKAHGRLLVPLIRCVRTPFDGPVEDPVAVT